MDGNVVLRRCSPILALLGTIGLLRAVSTRYDPDALADAERRLLAHVDMPLMHRFVRAGPHWIHTAVLGSGPPLVLLHGHGGGVGVWLNNLAPLAKHFRIYAVDWLGWGRSDRPRFTGRTAEAARDWWVKSLESWREAVGLNRFTLLGHSLGGWLAAEYAMVYGQHLRHLILANPAGLIDLVHPFHGSYYSISPQRLVQVAGPFSYRLLSYGCAEQAQKCQYDSEALLDYYYQLCVAPLSGQLAFQCLLTPYRWHLPLLPRAERIRLPTTILWGLEDPLLRVRDAHKLNLALPDSRLLLLPDASHSPHFDVPEQFNQAVIESDAQLAGGAVSHRATSVQSLNGTSRPVRYQRGPERVDLRDHA